MSRAGPEDGDLVSGPVNTTAMTCDPEPRSLHLSGPKDEGWFSGPGICAFPAHPGHAALSESCFGFHSGWG